MSKVLGAGVQLNFWASGGPIFRGTMALHEALEGLGHAFIKFGQVPA